MFTESACSSWFIKTLLLLTSLILSLSQSIQSLSCVQLFMTPWIPANWDSLSITNSQNLLKLMFIVSVMSSNHLILCRLLLLLPSIFLSIRVFSNETSSFPMSWFFTSSSGGGVSTSSDGQSIGVLVSASVFPINIQDWFLLGWTGWIPLQSKRLLTVFCDTTVQKHQFFSAQLSL